MTRRSAFLMVLVASGPILAQAAERGLAKATVAGKAVSIDYGRPELQGRDMLAKAEVGKPWRLGADAETTLKTEADLKFGTLAVPKGDYVLTATKVAEGQWRLDVTQATGGKALLGSAALLPEKVEGSTEMFTIELSGKGQDGEFLMKWGTAGYKTAFTAK